jgi:hypothetical protein
VGGEGLRLKPKVKTKGFIELLAGASKRSLSLTLIKPLALGGRMGGGMGEGKGEVKGLSSRAEGEGEGKGKGGI